MIDYGASSLVMRKCMADLLSAKYEPMVRDVLQLDGSSIKIIGILKNMEMTLYACSGFIVTQDISIVELPPHFFICLSIDFTYPYKHELYNP